MPGVPTEIPRDRRRLRRVNIQLVSGFPFEGKIYYSSRLGDFFQRPQSGTQYLVLSY